MKVHNFLLPVCVIFYYQTGVAQTLFSNASKEAGIVFEHVVEPGFGYGHDTGAAWFDIDGDTDLDLYVSQRNGNNRLYRNNLIGLGQNSFTDIAQGASLNTDQIGSGVSVADYDNDGDLDIYLANFDEDILLQNDGIGNFIDITEIAFPEFPSLIPGRGTTATWGDINNDGWLDLYVSNHKYGASSPLDYFFINNGGYPVTFSNMTSVFSQDVDEEGVVDNTGYSFVAAMTDYDNDNDLDIYVTNDCPFGTEDNKMWRNDGNMNFDEVSTELGPFIGGAQSMGSEFKIPDCQNAMGIAIGDPNRDGFFDMFYTNWNTDYESAVFLHNTGSKLFNKSTETGLEDIVIPETENIRMTWGTVFIDYNLDMLQDLAVAAGSLYGSEGSLYEQPNLLYENTGIKENLPQFDRIEDAISGIADINKGRTIVMGDYDMDGDPDLFLINFDGEAMLFQNNNKNQNSWLIVNLNGAGAPFSNRNGIGAKVKVTTADGISQYWEMRSGSSLGGGDDIAAYFGLAKNALVDIEVKWPSGIIQHTKGVQANQKIIIEEPALRVLSPFLADTIFRGEELNIVWENAFDGNVDVTLLKDKEEVLVLAENIETNELRWEIPVDFESGTSYSVRVVSTLKESNYAESYGYFTIGEEIVTDIDQENQSNESFTTSNYPNPFSSSTTIEYYIESDTEISISIYNMFGQRVNELVDSESVLSGKHEILFDGKGLPDGVYIYKVQSNAITTSGMMLKN